MDKNGKSRHSVWLSDDVWREVDALYKLDNCPTRNEFVKKALRQYCGRLHAERTGAYLPRALQEVLEGTLGVFGDRLGRLLFKLVVEHNMTNHLLGGDIDMTRDEYNKMRGSSIREVASTHGNISFKDVLLFHQEINDQAIFYNPHFSCRSLFLCDKSILVVRTQKSFFFDRTDHLWWPILIYNFRTRLI